MVLIGHGSNNNSLRVRKTAEWFDIVCKHFYQTLLPAIRSFSESLKDLAIVGTVIPPHAL